MAAVVWKGHLTFGLVSIPVRLTKAAQAERVKMHQLRRAPSKLPMPNAVPPQTRIPSPNETERPQPRPFAVRLQPQTEPPPPQTYTRVQRQWTAPEPVPASELVKGVEVEKGRYVAFEEPELKKLAAETSSEMKIEEFVKLNEIDPIYFENSYYVTPDESGERAYLLLFQAMKDANSVALAKFAMHGREHVVIVRPGSRGLIAHTMFYSDEIRPGGAVALPAAEPSPKELALALRLIESLEAPFQPEKYKDRYRERLEAIIAQRTGEARPVTGQEDLPKAEPVDILAALQASLAAVRKPAASVPARKRASRKTAN